jgi:hypothetical protein
VCFLTNPATSKQAAAAASSAPDGESRIYTDTQIYLSPLSSAYPGGSSGYSYSISSDGTLTFSKSGEAPVVLPRSKPWTRLTQAEWKALFKPDTFAPDISGVKKPLVSKLSERYYLFSMDGALWLGDYRNATVGMWSIYALTPDTAADSSSQQDDEAALRAKYFDFAVDWRLDYIPVFPAAGQTGAPSVSSDYLMWAFMLDYDRLSAQGDMEKDYVERQIKSHFEVTSLRHEGLRETWNFDGEKYTPYAGGIKGKPMALLKSLSQAEENGRTVYTLKLDFLTADHPLENPPEDSAEWRSLRQNIIDQQTDGLSVLSTDVFRFYLQSGEPVFLSHTQENASGQTEAVPLARCLTLFPGSTRALLNGEEIPLASAPYRENGNLYLPLEQTAAIFGISAAPVSGKSGQYAVSSGGDTLLFTEGQADFTILYSTGEQTAVTAEAAPENRDGVFCVPAKSAQFANINQAADLSQVILSEASPDELRAGPFQCNEPYDELPSDVRAEFTEQPVTDATLKAMGARRLVSADVELLVMKGGGYGPADAENILEIHLKTDRYHTARGLYVGAMAALDTELYGFPGPAADVVRVQVASKISNGLISEIVLHTMV